MNQVFFSPSATNACEKVVYGPHHSRAALHFATGAKPPRQLPMAGKGRNQALRAKVDYIFLSLDLPGVTTHFSFGGSVLNKKKVSFIEQLLYARSFTCYF